MSHHDTDDRTLEDLYTHLAGLDAHLESVNEQRRALESERNAIDKLIQERVAPFREGDIVKDEKGVQYRVTRVRVYRDGTISATGIRLTKEDGFEAHKDPRPIYSTRLEKVEV